MEKTCVQEINELPHILSAPLMLWLGGSGFVAQLCLTLCYPLDSSLPGFSVHEISQARILVQVAISFSRDVPNPGVESTSLTLAGEFFTTESPEKPP